MRVVGCFLEYDDKFVILLRHSHKPNGNTWGLPAGKVEEGEDDQLALLRELEEETGYAAAREDLEHLGNFDFGHDKKYTFATYRVTLAAPYNPVIEESAHAELKWVTAEECYAFSNLIPDLHELLELIGFVKK